MLNPYFVTCTIVYFLVCETFDIGNDSINFSQELCFLSSGSSSSPSNLQGTIEQRNSKEKEQHEINCVNDEDDVERNQDENLIARST